METATAKKKSTSNFELYPQDFERYMPPIKDGAEFSSEDSKQYIQKSHEILISLMEDHCSPRSLLQLRTHMIDTLLVKLCQNAFGSSSSQSTSLEIVLLAQGGYGRREMFLHSDIDILILYKGDKKAGLNELVEKMLYPLWDAGLDVGYAIRTMEECKKVFSEDVTAMTSLLDARYLAGSVEMFERLEKEIRKMLRSSLTQKRMMRLKIEEWKERGLKHGNSAYLLEPNIRDSRGGLRDLHLLFWLAQIQGQEPHFDTLEKMDVITADEKVSVKKAKLFLWQARNWLHLIMGKKSDVLGFAAQEKVAKKMGYTDGKDILAVERFMQDYYRNANEIAGTTETVVRRMTWRRRNPFQRLLTRNLDDSFMVTMDQIAARRKNVFAKDPVNFLRLFEHVQLTALPVHPETRDLVKTSLSLVDDSLRKNEEAIAIFRKIFGCYQYLGTTLIAMAETGFLPEWLPEFKKVVCRVQHDAYHIYTVDTHSIFAVNEISRLVQNDYGDKFQLFKKALSEVAKPEILTLGLFLHDIGKGEGGNHSVKGAVIGNGLTERLHYSEDDQRTVEFLVLSHLMMPHLSQRRDLEDQDMIVQFAKSMGTLDRLNMLFLLTWADIRAVGPNTWNDWKGSLLEKLYVKAREVIEKGEFSTEKTRERLDRLKSELMIKMADREDREDFERYISLMPARYFFATHEDRILHHFHLFTEVESGHMTVGRHVVTDQNATEIAIYTSDSPRILAEVTGVMLAQSLNILRMDAFQTKQGKVLVLVAVQDADGGSHLSDEKFERTRSALHEVLFGCIRVEELIAKRELPSYLSKQPVQRAPSKVVIDNDVSAYYTVIDVYTYDRLGVLYKIMTTLNRLGCYVDVSKIATKVEQVTDSFYVKDIFGKKIQSRDKLAQIKSELLKVVEE